MGLFDRQPKEPKSWTDEVESFANFAGDLKYATDRIIEAAVNGDEKLCELIWHNMTTEQRQYGFWFMLGMLSEVLREENYE